ncbi:pentapeptide repeat-containing protein [Piscirickettsia salmonis]|uniref:pentapeptide repeat-containing protein n=1 Tax=Piscirickettsia salmonis TaxID=1238 RepID=UPI0012BACF41|nr:pentapeptide repeat-containing protein [Piscirickettsia salmonis]QGP38181.1 Secreted effector protein PipB [Piscirickettsia salmonis]
MKKTRQDVINEINKAHGPEGSGLLDLSGWDLSGEDLSDLYLYHANLQCANLQSANLSQSYLQEASFQFALLNQANLSGAQLSQAVLTEADLTDANFSFAGLYKASLSSVKNFGNAQFERAYVVSADFKDAHLEQTNIDFAIFRVSDFPYSTKTTTFATARNHTPDPVNHDQMFENATLPEGYNQAKAILSQGSKKKHNSSLFLSARKKASNYNALFEDQSNLEDQPSLKDQFEDDKPVSRMMAYAILDANKICTLANHPKVINNCVQFHKCCRHLKDLDLYLQPEYMQKLLDEPQQSRVIKILLEEGLNKAIASCLEHNNNKKLTMANFFKSRLENEPLDILLKNAASALHHTSPLSVSSSKAYQAASRYFEEARKLLKISNPDWDCVLEQGSWFKRSKLNPDHHIFEYFKQYMKSHDNSLEGASLTPTLYSTYHNNKADDCQGLLASEENDDQPDQGTSAY